MKLTDKSIKLDYLGQLKISKKMRELLHVAEGEELEVHVEKKKIVIKKHEVGCVFCGETENTVKFMDKLICKKCLNDSDKY